MNNLLNNKWVPISLIVILIALGAYFVFRPKPPAQPNDKPPVSGTDSQASASDDQFPPYDNGYIPYSHLQKPTGPEPNQYTDLKRDLNGDGVMETIKLEIQNPEENRYQAILTVNGSSIIVPGGNPEGYFGIVDINTQNLLKDIAVIDEGPSNDYTTTFYTYDGRTLVTNGTIDGQYRNMKFDGKNGVTTTTRGNILDTWFHDDDYVLSGNKFIHKPRKFYERRGTTKVIVVTPLPLQRSSTDKSITTTLKKGENVKIVGCDDIAWCMMTDSKGIQGWFAVKDFNIITAVNLPASEVFEGLSYAD